MVVRPVFFICFCHLVEVGTHGFVYAAGIYLSVGSYHFVVALGVRDVLIVTMLQAPCGGRLRRTDLLLGGGQFGDHVFRCDGYSTEFLSMVETFSVVVLPTLAFTCS